MVSNESRVVRPPAAPVREPFLESALDALASVGVGTPVTVRIKRYPPGELHLTIEMPGGYQPIWTRTGEFRLLPHASSQLTFDGTAQRAIAFLTGIWPSLVQGSSAGRQEPL